MRRRTWIAVLATIAALGSLSALLAQDPSAEDDSRA